MPYDRPLYDFNESTDLRNYKAWVLGTMWYPPPGARSSSTSGTRTGSTACSTPPRC